MLWGESVSIERITSTKNETVKLLKGLRQKKNRTQMLLAEGEKCVLEALYCAKTVCVVADDENDPAFLEAEKQGVRCLLVTRAIMEAVSDAKTPQHVVAAVQIEKSDLPAGKGLYVALEDVADPGNVGTVIRTADAAGARAVVLSAGCADYTSPKVVRSTMGSVFHIPVIVASDFYGALDELAQGGNEVLAAALDGDETLDIPKNCCILIGNEARGLSERAKDAATLSVKIPMYGKAESLNAGVAASVLLYRAVWN